jgi:uncharacterized membrane protein YdjX (TVP38/TMEM64 family)
MGKRFVNFLKKHWIFILAILILITWMIYSYFFEGIIYSLINSDTTDVVGFVQSFGTFAAIIFVLLVILEVVLAPIPPLILYIVAGVLFGGFIGGILTLVGNSIGALIDFKLARRFGRKSIEKNFDKKLKTKFDNFFDKYGPLSIFILRINPLTTSDLVSYLSGLTKIKTWKFILATSIGLIPLIFIQTYLGDIFIKDNPVLLGITILFSILYLAIFVYLIILSLNKKKND